MNLRINFKSTSARSKSETQFSNKCSTRSSRRSCVLIPRERPKYPKKVLLERLQKRKGDSEQIPPSVGSSIVRSSILPIFINFEKVRTPKTPKRRKSENKRALLSSLLVVQLEDAKKELLKKRSLLRHAQSDLSFFKRRLTRISNKMNSYETNLNFLENKHLKIRPKIFRYPIFMDMKLMCDTSYKKWIKNSFAASLEFKNSTKIANSQARQAHYTAELKLKNTILGERLKSLYTHIKAHKELHPQLTTIISILTKNLVECEEKYETKTAYLKLLLKVNIGNLQANDFNSKSQNEIIQQINSVKVYTIDTIRVINKKLGIAEQAALKMKEKFRKTNKKYEDLKVLYERANDLFSQEEEMRICDNCRFPYNDEDNDELACNYHLSHWSGDMYWCCGKTNIDAPGCFQSEHTSSGGQKENLTNDLCSSCRSYGHDCKNCPKDPNPNSERQNQIKINQEFSQKKAKRNFFYTEENQDNWVDIERLKNISK